jgi:hypothetical protein
VTSLVGDVASVTASVHAALGGVSAGSSARSTRSRARLNRCGGDGWCGVSGRRACLLDRSSSRSASGEDLRSRALGIYRQSADVDIRLVPRLGTCPIFPTTSVDVLPHHVSDTTSMFAKATQLYLHKEFKLSSLFPRLCLFLTILNP